MIDVVVMLISIAGLAFLDSLILSISTISILVIAFFFLIDRLSTLKFYILMLFTTFACDVSNFMPLGSTFIAALLANYTKALTHRLLRIENRVTEFFSHLSGFMMFYLIWGVVKSSIDGFTFTAINTQLIGNSFKVALITSILYAIVNLALNLFSKNQHSGITLRK